MHHNFSQILGDTEGDQYAKLATDPADLCLDYSRWRDGGGTAQQRTEPTPKQAAEPPISARSFGKQNVIGYLGKPLGTVVRVTGTASSGNETRMKALEGKILLNIETVDGQPLKMPTWLLFGRAKNEIEQPRIGDKFDYYVHEYGSFDGIVEPPRELKIDSPVFAHDGFYYRKQITIHKSNIAARK